MLQSSSDATSIVWIGEGKDRFVSKFSGIGVASAEEIDVTNIDEKLRQAERQYQRDMNHIMQKWNNEKEQMLRNQRSIMGRMERRLQEIQKCPTYF